MNKNEDCGLVVSRQYTRRDERLKIMEAWRQSGMSAARYAKETGISARKLYRWQGAPLAGQEAAAFIELPVVAAGAWSAEVTSKAGSVRFGVSAPPVWAAALIRELNRC